MRQPVQIWMLLKIKHITKETWMATVTTVIAAIATVLQQIVQIVIVTVVTYNVHNVCLMVPTHHNVQIVQV
jgi:hypothetical protein